MAILHIGTAIIQFYDEINSYELVIGNLIPFIRN